MIVLVSMNHRNHKGRRTRDKHKGLNIRVGEAVMIHNASVRIAEPMSLRLVHSDSTNSHSKTKGVDPSITMVPDSTMFSYAEDLE